MGRWSADPVTAICEGKRHACLKCCSVGGYATPEECDQAQERLFEATNRFLSRDEGHLR